MLGRGRLICQVTAVLQLLLQATRPARDLRRARGLQKSPNRADIRGDDRTSRTEVDHLDRVRLSLRHVIRLSYAYSLCRICRLYRAVLEVNIHRSHRPVLYDCCIPNPCDESPYTNKDRHQTIPQCHLYRLWPTNPTAYSLLGPGWRAFLSSTQGLKMFSAGVLNWPRREPV